MKLKEILFKNELTKDDLAYLFEIKEQNELEHLFQRADEVRREHCGDDVHLRGIIEFSNFCEAHCLYCGLREDNFSIKRYRMTADEIIETARTINNIGIKTVVLQSGEDNYYDTDIISYIIYSIKQNSETTVTLSLGERGFDEYRAWKISGADRYMLKYETSNSKQYSIYHPQDNLSERLSHLKYLKRVGYEIGTGNLIGLPDQSIEDLVNDLLLIKNLDMDLASFAPFVPAAFTPYQNKSAGNVILALKTIAIARILLKDANILSTTALDSIDPFGREKGLNAGANVVMLNFTPQPYRENYQIYKNKRGISEHPIHSAISLQQRIEAIGKKVSTSQGNSLNINKVN